MLDALHPFARRVAQLGESVDESKVGMRRKLPGPGDDAGGLTALALRGQDAPIFLPSRASHCGLDLDACADELARLDSLPGSPGYVTETFCVQSRFFQPIPI